METLLDKVHCFKGSNLDGHLAMQAVGLFGEDVFRKWDGKKFTGGAVDVSLWDMIMLTLVDYSSADLQPFADKLRPVLLQLKLDIQAEAAPARVSQEKIKARIKEFTTRIDAIRGTTSLHWQQPRSFSKEVKVEHSLISTETLHLKHTAKLQ